MKKRVFRILTVLALVFSMVFSPVVSYGAQDAQSMQVNTLSAAVNNKDLNTILDFFTANAAAYYRAHGLEEGFLYFNADKYLEKYPDVAKAFNNDRKMALEHYLVFGIKENRSSCGTYDIPAYLRNHPEAILNADLLKAVANPEAYFTAFAALVKAELSKAGPGGAVYSGGSGSSGGSDTPYTPTPTPTPTPGPSPAPVKEKTLTAIYYIAGSNLEEGSGEMSVAILDTLLAMYNTDNVNLVMGLGDTEKWRSEYLTNLIGGTYGDNGELRKAAVFAINNAELKTALGKIMDRYQMSTDALYKMAHNGKNSGKELTDELIAALFNEKVMPMLAEAEKPIGDKSTLSLVLDTALGSYSADNYMLSFNDHGGGAEGGVSCVEVPDVADALKKAGFGTTQPKISFITMDACLMGGTEVAAILSDYYQYMYASEVTAVFDCEYYSLMKTAAQNVSSADLGDKIAYQAFLNRMDIRISSGITTVVVYDAAKADAAAAAIDSTADQLLTLSLGSRRADVFNAIKKASVKSYQISGTNKRNADCCYLDTQDFFNQLKRELGAVGITETDAAIDAAIKACDELSKYSGATYDKKQIFRNENGVVYPSEDAFWKTYLNSQLNSTSLDVPSYSYIYANIGEYSDNAQGLSDKIAELKQDYRNRYIVKYADQGFSHYCALMNAYLDYCLDTKELTRIKNLTDELLSGENADQQKVAGYDQLFDVTLEEDGTILQVKAADYEQVKADTGLEKSENSSGDAFVDLIDTAAAMSAYITRKIQAKLTDTSDVTLDVIIGEYRINYHHCNGAEEAVEIAVKELIENASVLSPANDRDLSDENGETVNYSDALIASSYSQNADMKKKLLLAIDTEYQKLLAEKEKTAEGSKEREEAEKKLEEYSYNFNTDNYALYTGWCDYKIGEEDGGLARVQHIFTIDKNEVQHYSKTVCVVDYEKGQFTVQDGVYAVGFYHYVLEENDDHTAGFRSIDDDDQYSMTEYQVYNEEQKKYVLKSEYCYDVGENKSLKIYKNFMDYLDMDASHNGYEVVITNNDGKEVILNKDNQPAKGSNYSGLLKNDEVMENMKKCQEMEQQEEKNKERTAEEAAEETVEETVEETTAEKTVETESTETIEATEAVTEINSVEEAVEELQQAA